MTIQAVHNPDGIAGTYLAALNRCFRNWGDESTFSWCFERRVGPHDPDLITLAEGAGPPIAGTGVTYRPVRRRDGERVQVGIMTGSWTLPEWRGRGCFTRLVEESAECARARGGALLLAFVVASNPSARRLSAAGAEQVPTYYLRSSLEPQGSPSDVAPAPLDDRMIADCLSAYEDTDAVHVAYSPDEWVGQFLARPRPTEVLAVEGTTAIVEHAPDVDHVLFVSPATPVDEARRLSVLAAQSARHGRHLRAFTVSPKSAEAAGAAGFEVAPGFLMVLALTRPGGVHWHLQSGDRM